LREGGTVPVGEAFSFLSGLYFRGKLAYGQRFARPPAGEAGVQVITTNRGLLPAEAAVGLDELRSFGLVDIRADDIRYREPFERDVRRLAADPAAREGNELAYGPAATAVRRGPRPRKGGTGDGGDESGADASAGAHAGRR
jgi:hypothetical protein